VPTSKQSFPVSDVHGERTVCTGPTSVNRFVAHSSRVLDTHILREPYPQGI
jgi:hypothetical protein